MFHRVLNTAVLLLEMKVLREIFLFYFLQIDDSRRRHNYDPFISTFLTMLAEQGHIANLLEQQNTIIKRVSTAYVKTNNNTVKKENKTIKKAKGKKIIKKKKKKV